MFVATVCPPVRAHVHARVHAQCPWGKEEVSAKVFTAVCLAVQSGGVVMMVWPCSGAWCCAGSRKKTVAPSSTLAAASFSVPLLLLSSLGLVCWCKPHGGGKVNGGLGLRVLLL